MDVTTVSPSPASPTEGDNPCETDGTNVAIHSVTLLICLCGLVGNGAVLCLLSLKLYNTGIFDLAFADFLFLLFTVPSTLLFLVEDMSCSRIIPLLYLSFLFQLSVLSSYWALTQLTFSAYNSNVYKLCMLWCRCDLPERLKWLVFSVPYRALIALGAVIPAVSYLCPSHQQEHCWAGLRYVYIVILLLFLVTTLIFIVIKLCKEKRASKKQLPMRRNVVFLLIMSFILLLILCNFLQPLGYIIVSSHVFFLLNCTQSSIKPFIYFLAGRCWSPCSLGSLQLSLQRVFDEQNEETALSNDAPMDTGV